jgi:hypothetical protein
MAVPIRIKVDPSSIAISKSPVMPMERHDQPPSSGNRFSSSSLAAANSLKDARTTALSDVKGAIVISPDGFNPGNESAFSAARNKLSLSKKPAFVSSPV